MQTDNPLKYFIWFVSFFDIISASCVVLDPTAVTIVTWNLKLIIKHPQTLVYKEPRALGNFIKHFGSCLTRTTKIITFWKSFQKLQKLQNELPNSRCYPCPKSSLCLCRCLGLVGSYWNWCWAQTWWLGVGLGLGKTLRVGYQYFKL